MEGNIQRWVRSVRGGASPAGSGVEGAIEWLTPGGEGKIRAGGCRAFLWLGGEKESLREKETDFLGVN